LLRTVPVTLGLKVINYLSSIRIANCRITAAQSKHCWSLCKESHCLW